VKKIAQNAARPFLSNVMHNLNLGKKCLKMWATSLIFKNTPKVNNHPMGEKLPNLEPTFEFTATTPAL
jgi:hypothetical protein